MSIASLRTKATEVGSQQGTRVQVKDALNLVADILDDGTQDLVVDSVAVTDAAYGAGWNGSVLVPTRNAVYDELEKYKVKAEVRHDTNTINTTSTSFASMSTDCINTITVASGEYVELNFNLRFSHSSAGINSYIELCDGTTQIVQKLIRSDGTGNTTGGTQDASISWIVKAPNTGSRTYRARWKTDSGTLYSLDRFFTAKTLKAS